MSQSYQIKIIDSLKALKSVSKEWNDLLNESYSNTVFLSWEWIYTWTESFLGSDRILFILAVYKDKELVGIAPCCIHKIRRFGISLRQIEFLGTPEAGSDYLDVFITRGKEKEVVKVLYRFLFQEAPILWDSINLNEIPAESRFLLHFLQQLEEDGKYFNLQPGSFSPFVVLPRDTQEFFGSLSSNRREQFMRHSRILEKKGVVAQHTYNDLKSGIPLKMFGQIYKKRWQEAEELILFIKNLSLRLESNMIQIEVITVDGIEIAALCNFERQNKIYMFLMAIDHSFDKSISIGNILVGLSIKKAISEGRVIFDFLKGSEDYKFHWANSGRRSISITYYSKKIRPVLWMLGTSIKSIAKVLIR